MVVNNMAVGYGRPTRWAGYFLDRWVTACVSMFITGSNAAKGQLKSVLRLTDAQCRSIHNGISLRPIKFDKIATKERLGISDFEGLVFGVVAILRPNKGHHVLLQAVSQLASANSLLGREFKVLIEGDGPLGDTLKAFTKQMKLDSYCSFVGSESSIADFMESLDVLVLPSIGQEDFPNVILEAMGVGKAVIATRVAGIPEQVVDGQTGLLVAPGNVDQLADAMRKLIYDRTCAERLGKAGNRRFLESFSAAKSVTRYMELYQSLIKAESL
jgi:glycosyltransferase involved in cell wall biosynthesis